MQRSSVFNSVIISVLFIIHFASGRLIDGIFTEPTLKPGYNLVTSVPRGAKALNVTQLGNTSNILAVTRKDRNFILNGNYNAFANSGSFVDLGTTFVYTRHDSHNPESLAAEGPLQEPIDILVFYKEPNPGIVYRYLTSGQQPTASRWTTKFAAATSKTSNIFPPGRYTARRDTLPVKNRIADDEAQPLSVVAPQRRLRRRRFVWKNHGLAECSRSCGGGIQTTKFVCIREQSQQQVPDKRCHHLEKPVGQTVRCNTRLCPAKWRAGVWSDCSVSCGTGYRTREMECVQEVTSALTMRVADGACIEPSLLPLREGCVIRPCDDPLIDKSQDVNVFENNARPSQWNAEPWSECSATCGPGRRTRIVSCITTTGRPCSLDEKPPYEESCNLGNCSPKLAPPVDATLHSNSISTFTSGSRWLFTEWSRQCSADCGTGVQWRRVVCGSSSPETCDESTKPKTTQECTTDDSCSGHWFSGPWTRCSAACEIGEQTREVICVAKIRGILHVALDMNCPVEKPDAKRHCRGPPCPPAWFASDWSECTRTCGRGMQQRVVKCLESDGRPAQPGRECPEADRPVSRLICNEHPCRNSDDNYGAENVNRVVQIQNDPEISNRLDDNPNCQDTNFNCPLVAQARLCNYEIYRRTCCLSCSKARMEDE
ncbi:ADAMTS-like protein 4 isoform X2 [Neodiprion pinetum]|uniref:ADAMTS-like protein 4 isoform X2 n=1 Tax=Neodiprion pinetum TaxID=441929 RepID=UPI0037198BA7